MSKPVVFFYCYPQRPVSMAGYQHGIIGLAEGLEELGIPFYSNANYWPLTPEADNFLFNHSPDVTPDDCDIVVLNDVWFSYGYTMPPQLFRRGRKYLTVYMDHSDNVVTAGFRPEFRQFDFIFKAHFNNLIVGYPVNMRPWAFGLTNRIINATANGLPWEKRKRVLLSNFRVDHPLRQKAREYIYPVLREVFEVDESNDNFTPPENSLDYLEWKKTGRRHNSAYYEKLKQSQAVSCFGGMFFPRFLSLRRIQRIVKIADRLLPVRLQAVYQWDSFRLWEAFSAGCLVLHIDFEKYGLQLPVMPKNLRHYLGIDFDNMKLVEDILCSNTELLAQISENGKRWALEHYSPKETARRFLATLGF